MRNLHRTNRSVAQRQITPNSQQGLTLIELMISITLGLLISAAAFQIFANSVNSQRIQSSAADVQEAAIFNLNYMKKEIAMANLGSSSAIKKETPWTGVVLTGSESYTNSEGVALKTGNLRGVKGDQSNLLTQSATGPSNLDSDIKSDQLTLQYRAPFDGFDCEGKEMNQGEMVVERFFTRVDNQKASNESTDALAIVLACDAARYVLPEGINADNIKDNDITLSGLGTDSVILVNRVDYFEVKLGVQNTNGSIDYLTITDYKADTTNRPIVAIQYGVIVRGNSAVSGSVQKTFNVNGTDRTINEEGSNYIRRVYQSVVSIRNSGSE